MLRPTFSPYVASVYRQCASPLKRQSFYRNCLVLVRLALLLVVLALAACSGTSRQQNRLVVEARAQARTDSARFADPRNRVVADSGLVYEYRPCASYTFDSATSLLVRRGRAGGPDTLRAELTPSEFAAVVAEADRIGLWSYPADFGDAETLDIGPDSSYVTVMPSGSYRIDLRAGGRAASVRWSEAVIEPLSERAARLRDLGRQVEAAFDARSKYDQFPDLGYGCL